MLGKLADIESVHGPRFFGNPSYAPQGRRPDRSNASVASTIARANALESVDLKIPLPTNTPLGAHCHHQCRVGRCCDAARAEQHHRQPLVLGDIPARGQAVLRDRAPG